MGGGYVSHLFVEQVEGQLESNRLHVGPLQRRRDVHVHVEEPGRGVDGLWIYGYMSQLLLLGKFEYGGGLIFKVVLDC